MDSAMARWKWSYIFGRGFGMGNGRLIHNDPVWLLDRTRFCFAVDTWPVGRF